MRANDCRSKARLESCWSSNIRCRARSGLVEKVSLSYPGRRPVRIKPDTIFASVSGSAFLEGQTGPQASQFAAAKVELDAIGVNDIGDYRKTDTLPLGCFVEARSPI